MIKGKDLIGRNVVAMNSGTQINKVQDLVFDHDANQVLALLVDEGGWFKAAKVVPYEAIHSIGEDAVMIADEAQVVSARDDSRIAELLDTKVGLIGLQLLTTDGRELGKIADAYFDEQNGKVLGYEATGGLFSDLSSGRTFVPAPESVSIGNNAAIVPVSVAEAMEEQEPGGLQGALSRAGDTFSENYENLSAATKARQKEYVTGKVAGSEVAAQDGTVLVHKGETISAEQAERAEAQGLLGSLVAAATGGSMQAAYSGAAAGVQDRVEDLGQASQERQIEYVTGKLAGHDVSTQDGIVIVSQGDTVSQAQAQSAADHHLLGQLVAAVTSGSVQTLYASASSSVHSRVEDLTQASRERQVEYVLGKVAGRDVRGDDDSVIVLEGQTITPLAVQSAESQQALGRLVASAMAGTLQSGAQRLSENQRGASEPAPRPAVPSVSVLGRRVRSDVYGPHRTMIAAQGQIVTQGVLDLARQLGREDELLQATGVNSSSSADAGGPALGDQLSAGVANVSAGASSLLDRARQWLGEKHEQAVSSAERQGSADEEQRVRDALGRPVNRVILDPNDTIILNIGEIITNKAVAAARQAGVLDMLLGSVSTETVSINPLDVRPHETGSAALPGQGEVELGKPQP